MEFNIKEKIVQQHQIKLMNKGNHDISSMQLDTCVNESVCYRIPVRKLKVFVIAFQEDNAL